MPAVDLPPANDSKDLLKGFRPTKQKHILGDDRAPWVIVYNNVSKPWMNVIYNY